MRQIFTLAFCEDHLSQLWPKVSVISLHDLGHVQNSCSIHCKTLLIDPPRLLTSLNCPLSSSLCSKSCGPTLQVPGATSQAEPEANLRTHWDGAAQLRPGLVPSARANLNTCHLCLLLMGLSRWRWAHDLWTGQTGLRSMIGELTAKWNRASPCVYPCQCANITRCTIAKQDSGKTINTIAPEGLIHESSGFNKYSVKCARVDGWVAHLGKQHTWCDIPAHITSLAPPIASWLSIAWASMSLGLNTTCKSHPHNITFGSHSMWPCASQVWWGDGTETPPAVAAQGCRAASAAPGEGLWCLDLGAPQVKD